MISKKGGRTIDHYALKKQLGDGTFGVGWIADNTLINETVCVKIFKNLSADSEKSFKKEIETGGTDFKHPNIL
jgi:hypothetical protein